MFSRILTPLLLGSLVASFLACSGASGSDPGTTDEDGGVSAPQTDAGGSPKTDSSVPTGEDAGADAASSNAIAVPKFASSTSYSTTVTSTNDPIDIYYPTPTDLATGGYKFPIVVFVQGANVDKANYSTLAGIVARYGFIVAIPNHTRTLFLLTGLYPEPSDINSAFAFVAAEAVRSASPIATSADPTRLGVMGHSLGSVVGLDLISQDCTSPVCAGSFTSPGALRGGAFYGASLKPLLGGSPPATDVRGLGAMLIQGSVDGLNAPADAKATYDQLSNGSRAFVTLTGANHYGVTNANSPSGAQADSKTPTLAQATATETIARFSAVFLLATVAGNADAKAYITSGGAGSDPNVTVTSAF